MLLIHHNQPKVLKWQEQRRPRAHHQPRLAGGHHPPQPPPLGHRDAGMPLRRPCAKPCLDPIQELRRQRNFRQQHQRLPPRTQTFRHRLKVNLGLPRPRHPLQQRRRIAPQRHRRRQGIPRRDLIPLQPHPQIGAQQRIGHIPRRILLGHNAQLDQPLYHRRATARRLHQFTDGDRSTPEPAQSLHHPVPRLGQLVRHRPRQPVHPLHRRRLPQPRGPRGQPQHRGQRRQRIFRRPRQKRPQLQPHRPRIQHPSHGPHTRRVEIPKTRPPDHAQDPPRPQGHLDEIPVAAPPLRRAIVQDAPQRFRRQHAHQIARAVNPLCQPASFPRAPVWSKPRPDPTQPTPKDRPHEILHRHRRR